MCVSLGNSTLNAISVGSRFHVLRFRTHFGGIKGVRSRFHVGALSETFRAEMRAPSSTFMFPTPRLDFGSTEGIRSRFHGLRSRTHFRLYRERQVLFSCLALPDSFSVVLRASGPVFMFYDPALILGDTEGVRSRLHVLRSRTHFRRYQGR
jgi:hypothetical protein